MRRKWLTVLFFALALAIQALAPIATNVAYAGGGGSASTAFELCLNGGGFADDQTQTPGQANRRHENCPLCQTFCDGAAPLAGRSVFLRIVPPTSRALSSTEVDRFPLKRPFEHSHQARAPPLHS